MPLVRITRQAMVNTVITPSDLPLYEDDDAMPRPVDLYPTPPIPSTERVSVARTPSPFALDAMRTAVADIDAGTIDIDGILWSRSM